MKRKIIAWILQLALIVSLLAAPAIATEMDVPYAASESGEGSPEGEGGSTEPQQQSAPAEQASGDSVAAPEPQEAGGNASTNNGGETAQPGETEQGGEATEGGETVQGGEGEQAGEPTEGEQSGEAAEGAEGESAEGETTGEGEQTEVGNVPAEQPSGTVEEIGLSGAPKSAFVGEQINFLLHISGTAQEYKVDWETEAPDGTSTDSITTGAVDVLRSYMPHSYGTYTFRITVSAPDGSYRQAMAVVPVADHSVESEDEMFGAFRDYERTGNWNADMLAIAKSQIGTSESERNFYIDNLDANHGWTRYGAYYGGAEYDPWDALFVNFVARMAGIPEEYLPKKGTTSSLQKALADAGAAIGAEHILTTAEPGDLLFVMDGDALKVGVLASVGGDGISVILGDCDDRVQVVDYENGSGLVLGFGDLSVLYDKAVAENAPTEEEPEETPAPEASEGQEQEERVTGRTGVIYYCGFEPGYQHTHDESCYKGGDVPQCGLFEHTHTEKCTELPLKETPEPEEEPTAEPTEEPSAEPTEEPSAEPTEEPIEELVPEYICGKEEHEHEESCYDENGELICGLEAHAHDESCLPPEAEAEQAACEYERDADGNLILDESGNPIPILAEGATEKPVAWLRDADGNLILDENGNPIPVRYVKVGAEKIRSLADELDPNRHIDIYIRWADEAAETHNFGDEAVLTAVLTGYDNVEYALQWQTGKTEDAYEDVPGATEAECVTVVTEENLLDYWRVAVTITDVAEAAEEAEIEA